MVVSDIVFERLTPDINDASYAPKYLHRALPYEALKQAEKRGLTHLAVHWLCGGSLRRKKTAKASVGKNPRWMKVPEDTYPTFHPDYQYEVLADVRVVEVEIIDRILSMDIDKEHMAKRIRGYLQSSTKFEEDE